MIPKIIHNAWFGRGEKADHFKKCMDTWRLHCPEPEWQYRETNEDNFGTWMQTPYVASVLARKEFVKATELGRLVALYNFGGIYLDADVEIIKDPSPLLSYDFFIVREEANVVNGAVIGAKPFSPVVKALIDAFPVDTRGEKMAVEYGPTFLTRMMGEIDPTENEVTLPPHVAYPYLWHERPEQARIQDDTYFMHHWAGSWLSAEQRAALEQRRSSK